MVATTQFFNNSWVSGENFYQQLNRISNTEISLNYEPKKLLTFRVYKAYQGQIVWSGTKAIGLQCSIDGKIYTFNREHLNQMSNRELSELFNHLKIDGSQLLLANLS
jgi:hypothetical protein